MNKLLELADRCEKATAPDRELDRAIWRECLNDTGLTFDDERDGHPRIPAWIKPFTGSLDAARSLVPDTHSCASGDCGENNGPWACVTEPEEPCRDFSSDEAATEPLAICAAALRSRTNGDDV